MIARLKRWWHALPPSERSWFIHSRVTVPFTLSVLASSARGFLRAGNWFGLAVNGVCAAVAVATAVYLHHVRCRLARIEALQARQARSERDGDPRLYRLRVATMRLAGAVGVDGFDSCDPVFCTCATLSPAWRCTRARPFGVFDRATFASVRLPRIRLR